MSSRFSKCEHCGELVPKSRVDTHECDGVAAGSWKLTGADAAKNDDAPKKIASSPEKEEKKAKKAPAAADKEKKSGKGKGKGKKNEEGGEKKKRAPSAYILFTMDMRAKVKEEMPELKQKDILVELGKRWKALSEEEKKKYTDKAQESKATADAPDADCSEEPTAKKTKKDADGEEGNAGAKGDGADVADDE